MCLPLDVFGFSLSYPSPFLPSNPVSSTNFPTSKHSRGEVGGEREKEGGRKGKEGEKREEERGETREEERGRDGVRGRRDRTGKRKEG